MRYCREVLAKYIGQYDGKFGSTEFWTLAQSQPVFEAHQLFPLSNEDLEDHRPSLPKQESDTQLLMIVIILKS